MTRCRRSRRRVARAGCSPSTARPGPGCRGMDGRTAESPAASEHASPPRSRMAGTRPARRDGHAPARHPRRSTTRVAAARDPVLDAVLGPAVDGGYWAIGFRRARSARRVPRGADVARPTPAASSTGAWACSAFGTTVLPVIARRRHFGRRARGRVDCPGYAVCPSRRARDRPRGERSDDDAPPCLRTSTDVSLASPVQRVVRTGHAPSKRRSPRGRARARHRVRARSPPRRPRRARRSRPRHRHLDSRSHAARDRGVNVLERSVFDRVPGAGRWRSALLLRRQHRHRRRSHCAPAWRVAALLRPGRYVSIVELEPRPTRARRCCACARASTRSRAVVPLDHRRTRPPPGIADRAGYVVVEAWDSASIASPCLAGGADDRDREPSRFREPLHDERVAARLGIALGVTFTVCFVTGLWSHLQQNPPAWFDPFAAARGSLPVHPGTARRHRPRVDPDCLLAKLWVGLPEALPAPGVLRRGVSSSSG